jgi:hypothetical protein
VILSARLLKNVANVNQWQYTAQWNLAEGQPSEVYFQLVDLEKDPTTQVSKAFPDNPLRYISSATSLSAQVSFDSLDNSEIIIVSAIQPFANDRSIFKLNLTAAQIPSSGNVKFTIIEDSVSRSFIVKNAVIVQMLNVGGC